MKLLIEFLPIVLFFFAYKTYDLYVATGVLIIATLVQMIYLYFTQGKHLETLQKVTLAMIVGFGLLTIVLHDDRFIKWKPTVLYAGMAIGLAIGLWGYKKSFIYVLLGKQLTLPTNVWKNLTLSWIAYCSFMAALNAIVASYFSTDTWMHFKLWGYIFPVVFLIVQGIYIAKHLQKSNDL